ncbi:hypothetical protein GCM10029976_094680 [Kribbella albertanoniae]|uniref:SH3 domain-containing protein n=1 Tax=Kribbella albertanoniae TaxID=1266829 RepID=A0A4R4PNT6_9ACTN|nr:hypothetical protein [Kribbella albertanoniae]TDC23729.1 hypothetical protein E1261_27770 [Kribbella albertanoniae]
MSRLVNIGRVVAGTALAASSLAVINVSSAHAIDCSQSFPDNSPNSVLIAKPDSAYHTGPGAACAVKDHRSGQANILCYKFNEFGHRWFYARDLSTPNLTGWIWEGNTEGIAGVQPRRCGA